MPAKFQIIRPESTTNLITSPSLEGDVLNFPIPPYGVGSVLGWELVGSVLTLVTTEARFGTHSLEIVTAGLVDNEGTYFRIDPNTLDTYYAGSVYVRGTGRVRARIVDSMGDQFVSDPIQLSNNRWQRIIDVIGRTGPVISNDLRLYIETVGIQAITYYVDGGMIEPGVYSTTYTDGDRDGCSWEFIRHAGISSRDPQERSGGRYINLDEESLGLYVTVMAGAGLPPLRHNVVGRALLPGVEFQSTKILPRAIQITFWTKESGSCPGALGRLHRARSELINLIKPDLVSPTQPFVLRYTGGSVPVDIECYYEAGLELDADVRNQYFNSFTMRMLAVDPFWEEDSQEIDDLGFIKSLLNADYITARIDGEWQDIGPNTNNDVRAIAVAPDGRVYMGGDFTNIGGVAASRIAWYDGDTFYPLGLGVGGMPVRVNAIAVGQGGIVYIGGQFTIAGGAAAFNIVSWNPATGVYTTLGPGLNGTVAALAVLNNGDLCVGGLFNDVQGGLGNSLNFIARWDISNLTWNSMGAGPGFNTFVTSLAILSNDDLYIGGLFISEFGGVANTVNRIAFYDASLNTITQVGNGLNNTVNDVVLGDDNIIYIGGVFNDEFGGPGNTYNRVVSWIGSAFVAMSSGVDASVTTLTATPGGGCVVGGILSRAGGLTVNNLALWNGSTFAHIDVIFPVTTPAITPYATIYKADDLYVGMSQPGQAWASFINTINNGSTREVYPIISVLGPGILKWIENQSTKDILYLDLILLANEIVTIDFRPGTRGIISDWAGNRMDDLLPNSDFADFRLVPGDNIIAVFINDEDPNTEAQIRWTPTHWSVDGSVL